MNALLSGRFNFTITYCKKISFWWEFVLASQISLLQHLALLLQHFALLLHIFELLLQFALLLQILHNQKLLACSVTGLNNVVLSILFIVVNNIEQYC